MLGRLMRNLLGGEDLDYRTSSQNKDKCGTLSNMKELACQIEPGGCDKRIFGLYIVTL